MLSLLTLVSVNAVEGTMKRVKHMLRNSFRFGLRLRLRLRRSRVLQRKSSIPMSNGAPNPLIANACGNDAPPLPPEQVSYVDKNLS